VSASESRLPFRLSLLLAGALGIALAQSVYNIPIQVSDSLDIIIESRQSASSWDLFVSQTSHASATTLRPGRYLQARWLGQLADAGGGAYHMVFRGLHALLACAIVVLFAWVARARSATDVAALGIALTVLLGHHTFSGMMREAYPVNHYAEIACGALLTVGIAQRRPRALPQIVAVTILVAGLLVIESAVLLWVVLVGCVVIGLPGITRRTAFVATALLVVYLAARPLLDISSPGIGSHGSGWLTTMYSADELATRFGGNPWPFYAYNVLGGALSVLISDPRFGVYRVLSWPWAPVVIVHLVSSLALSAAILGSARVSMRRPVSSWTAETRLTALAAVVLAVSALLCATYIKDEIISTAGVFYALAAYAAIRRLFDLAIDGGARGALAAVSIVLAASLWGFRTAGTHYELGRTAFVTRNDWVLEATPLSGDDVSAGDRGRFSTLRADALRHRVTSPSFLPQWGERYWIE
jgi:hypothetical protein